MDIEDGELTEMLARLARAHGENAYVVKKRGPGRPPIENKEPMQDLHISLPAKVVKALDDARGIESRSEYLLRLLSEDTQIKWNIKRLERPI